MQLIPHRIKSTAQVNTSSDGRDRWRLPELGLRFSERRLLLGTIDLLLVNIALLLTLIFRSQVIFTLTELWGHLPWFILLSGLWLLIGSLFNIYNLAKAASAMPSAWSTSGVALLTTIFYSLIPYLTPALPNRRLEILLLPLLATIGVAAWRIFYANIFVQPAFHQTALVVGAGGSGRTLARAIVETGYANGNPYRGTGYHVLGFIDDDVTKQEQEIEGVPVLGTRYDLVGLAKKLNPDEIIVAMTYSQLIHKELFQAILDCRELGFPITTMTSLYERMTGSIPIEHAGQNLDVVLPISQPIGYRLYMAVRRIFDLVIALYGSLFLLILIPFIWLANFFTDPGDLFYRQERIGKAGKPFKVIKFRSMVMDAEKYSGAVWASENDPRITAIGRFLRKTRLDEVPQFWNILKGEMSFIGPRPERPHFVSQLAEEIPFYRVRHAVKPGLTGWAQVKYRYGASVEDALIKLEYDLYYIKHQGPYLDVLILLKTIQVILGFKGR